MINGWKRRSVRGYSKRMFYVASNSHLAANSGKNESLVKLQFHWRHWTIKSNPQPQLQAAHRHGPKIWILNAQSLIFFLWSSHRITSLLRRGRNFNLVLAGVYMIQAGTSLPTSAQSEAQSEESKPVLAAKVFTFDNKVIRHWSRNTTKNHVSSVVLERKNLFVHQSHQNIWIQD